MSRSGGKSRYRWAAFTHWLNLGLVAAAGVAGAVIDPAIWFAALPLEAGALWIIPDLPNFQAAVDEEYDALKLRQEREYYMEQLWGLRPSTPEGLGDKLIGLFATREEVDLDLRVVDRSDPSFHLYQELKEIVGKLHDLQRVRNVSLPASAFERFEQVITAYLRMVVAYRALARAMRGIDETQLKRELQEVDAKLEKAPRELRQVLQERRRLCQARLQRLPKMMATLELYKTRADAVVYQLRNLHGQVLADPGTDVTGFLDDLVERQEILADPLGDLEADQTIHELLHPEMRQKG